MLIGKTYKNSRIKYSFIRDLRRKMARKLKELLETTFGWDFGEVSKDAMLEEDDEALFGAAFLEWAAAVFENAVPICFFGTVTGIAAAAKSFFFEISRFRSCCRCEIVLFRDSGVAKNLRDSGNCASHRAPTTLFRKLLPAVFFSRFFQGSNCYHGSNFHGFVSPFLCIFSLPFFSPVISLDRTAAMDQTSMALFYSVFSFAHLLKEQG
ncbi:hypothetical protein KSP40_PGU010152 [Platanthera guangdongensis]|uniref:Uncharacterized protein n=1 Tax=Platanthera guangdongensis TaxID=2320717 RepID=A0ABR2MMP9_9ASPA